MGRILTIVLSILYPCLVFVGLTVFKTPPRVLSLCVAVVVAFNFLSITGKRAPRGGLSLSAIALPAALGALVVAVALTNSERLLKFYPVLVSASLLGTFGFTLLRPPSMILRFATVQDKALAEKPDFPRTERYCRNVTVVWCVFFFINMSMALYTTFFASSFAWSLYNGLISYILIGILFVGEMVVRPYFQKK